LDEARPGGSRFENVSNGVELAAPRRDATKSLTAITGTMVKNELYVVKTSYLSGFNTWLRLRNMLQERIDF